MAACRLASQRSRRGAPALRHNAIMEVSVPKIRFGYIGGAIRRQPHGIRCARSVESDALAVRPYSRSDGSGFHYNTGRKSGGPGAGAGRHIPEMVNALAPDGADQSFGKRVLPRRPSRNRLVANTHRSQTTISITDQVAWRLVPGESLGDLPRDPFGRRVRRYVDPDKLAPSQSDNDQGVEQVEPNGRHDNQVHRRNLRPMVAQKSSPTPTGRVIIPPPRHLLAVDWATANPSLSSSPCMYGAPQTSGRKRVRRPLRGGLATSPVAPDQHWSRPVSRTARLSPTRGRTSPRN